MNLQRVQSVSSPGSASGIPGDPPSSGGSGAPGFERPLFRLNLLRALQLHRRLALGIALGGLLLAIAYVLKAWPAYTAQSQLYVQPIQSKVMAGPDQSFTSNSAAYDSFVQQQVQSASNPDVLISALHKLKPGAWQRPGETEQAAAARLGGTIEVARQGTSYEVAIAAKARDPQLVAQIANAVAASVVEHASGEGNAGSAQRIAVLQEERDRIQNALTADYAEQDTLNKQLGMAAVGAEAPDLIDADIGKTREELIRARTDHDQAEAHFAAMGAGKGESSSAIDAEADDLVAADAGLTSMKTSLNARRAVLITQMSNLTPSNPEYKQDAAELAKINGSLDTMMKDLRAKAAGRIQQKLRMDLERTAGVESRLNGQLRQLTGAAASATPKLQRASDLATDIARLRTRFTSVDEQLHNIMLESSAPGAVHMSVAAVPPLHPTVSGILKKALPLVLAGLLFGLLAASIANHLDPRVYIGADIEQVLGFAPMAVLPDFDEVSGEVSAEHLLRLSAAIEHARQQGDLNNCIFTGASSGVGVTTLTVRVRDVLEAMGRPTVLLDSSRTPPPAPRGNSMEDAPDESATQRGSRSTALLRRVAAESELEGQSLVLTDTAPLLLSAETEYLARFVDCAIVVAESGVTTRGQLLAAVNTLQRLNVAAMGFVLNRVKLATADPQFRRSVNEIEKHHRAQSTSDPRRPDPGQSGPRQPQRTGSVADDIFPDAKELPSESAAKRSSATGASEPGSGPGAYRPPAAVSQWSTAAPVKPWLPQSPRPVGKLAADEADSDQPWWLSDGLSRTPTPPEPVSEPKPHRSANPASPAQDGRPHVLSIESWESTAGRSVEYKPHHVEEPARAATVEYAPGSAAETASPICAEESPIVLLSPSPLAAETFIPAAANDPSSIFAEKVEPTVPRSPAPSVAEKIVSVAVPLPASAGTPQNILLPDHEEQPIQSTSRLNALRGLIFSIGLKNLNKTRESLPLEEPSPLAPASAVAAIPVSPTAPEPQDTVRPAAPPIEFRKAQDPIKEVTTIPEILPPKEFIPVREGDSTRPTSSPSRSDRREAWDEVQILPSRRGQYKRRT